MSSDQTPRQPQALPPEGHVEEGPVQDNRDAEFAESLAGESGDPIWEARPPQSESGRAERARRAIREPEGRLPAGRLIDLEQSPPTAQRPAGAA